jgi:uncharacterized membrane protein YedE/YeeE
VIISGPGDNKEWTVAYFLGLLASGAILAQARPEVFGAPQELSSYTIVAAGVLTGVGTRLGSGCTSGHGVCGLPRRSPRSLAAVLTFMSTGALSAYLSRETRLSSFIYASDITSRDSSVGLLVPSLIAMATAATLLNQKFFLHRLLFGSSPSTKPDHAESKGVSEIISLGISFTSALIFGLGLGVSGMCNPERVISFLNFSGEKGFDPTLIGVMGGGVLFNLVSFHLLNAYDPVMPLSGKSAKISTTLKMGLVPENTKISWELILGSAIFGLGWGLGGICPGPGIVSLGGSVKAAGVFIPSLISGMAFNDFMFNKKFT